MSSLIRRRLVIAAALLPVSATYGQNRAPRCGKPTPGATEGPFYKRGTPERASFVEAGTKAQRLVITGQVLSARNCEPIAGAFIDFWHADEHGQYDNAGYRYRGHQRTDEQGRYRLETIVPAEYPGRTRHIHVKVQAPGGPMLTTQLYFPSERNNQRDGLYRRDLEMTMSKTDAGEFSFVVES